MVSAARLISCRVMSAEPVTVKTTPVALRKGKSRSGEEMAARAASCARVLPVPVPMPRRAVPESFITAYTSAKSTLIRPGFRMMSEMPTTPWRRMSSATEKACCSGKSSGTVSSSLSLETTISVSTFVRNISVARAAHSARLRPSNEKGLVITPTVRQPISLAISAITGAAPEPVPPPMPAVTKTRSAPLTISRMASLLSSAASIPISAEPPAPSPRVTLVPIVNLFAARDCASTCASVLTAQNSTDDAKLSTMRFTALPPPPPMPITLITQGRFSGTSARDAS
mmetsp:Transcript_15222/g.35401  ORF Transcript_15222/g.35401 Transcript_15222/m.35401 type:complete len:284 (+) Transcript_15222:196-1047(+)